MRALFTLLAAVVLAGAVWAEGTATNAVVLNADDEFARGLQAIQARKYATAVESFRQTVAARPVFPEAYINWGIALVQLGRQSMAVDQQLQAYQQAAEKFSKAAEQKPDDKLTQLLWSEVLILIGDMPVDGRVRLGCYQGAVERCRRAAQLAPTEWEIYNKWGAILSTKLADFAVDDKARVQLYKEAAELFSKAAANARFSSEVAPLYSNWGSALIRASRLAVDPSEKTKLLTEAIEKFNNSARAIPNAAGTYAMWGNSLIERGKLTRLRGDFREGIDRLNTAISLNPKDGVTYYSLARAYAVIGNNIMAIDTLKKLSEIDPLRTIMSEVARDPDMAPLSKEPEFQELVNPGQGRGIPSLNPKMRDRPR